MIFVFDLDDTLYNELTYVESGFRVVASLMEREWNIPHEASFKFMLNELKISRNRIFDKALQKWRIFSKNKVRLCLSAYRLHKPDIKLYDDADKCLQKLRAFPIYIVTDGNKNAQLGKIKALGLEKRVKKIFITYRYGIKNAKPSPYCYNKICLLEKAEPSEVYCIGDNPKKDFIGIKPLGFRTIRILRGPYKSLKLNRHYEVDITIKSFDQLLSLTHLKTIYEII